MIHEALIVLFVIVFFQWELISGPDLLDLLNECGGCMPEDVAAFYFHQLAKGVVFMHDNGFCHRDLKPENCMVEKTTQLLKVGKEVLLCLHSITDGALLDEGP